MKSARFSPIGRFSPPVLNASAIPARHWLGRCLRWPLRWIPKDLALPILQGPLMGARWIVGSYVHGCWLGSYESRKQQHFARHLRPGDVVYDIGANAGFYTLLAARQIGPLGHVYAFEPVPRNLAYLYRHIARNGIGNAEVFELAVSDQDGEAFFDDTRGHSSGQLSSTGRLCVRTATLDALRIQKSLRPPDCLKIDVEGAEAAVLRGARRLLERYRPRIFVATHGKEVHQETIALLRQYGYSVCGLAGIPLDQTDELIAMPQEDHQRDEDDRTLA